MNLKPCVVKDRAELILLVGSSSGFRTREDEPTMTGPRQLILNPKIALCSFRV